MADEKELYIGRDGIHIEADWAAGPDRSSNEMADIYWGNHPHDPGQANVVPGTLHATRLTSPPQAPEPEATGGESLRMGWNSTAEERLTRQAETIAQLLEENKKLQEKAQAYLSMQNGTLGSLGQANGALFSTNSLLSAQAPPAEVTHPPHYTRGGIECKVVIEAWELNYYLGTALKYICRADYKGDPIQDLQKAITVLRFEIDRRRNKSVRTREKQSERQFRNPYSGAGSSTIGPKASSIPGSGGNESYSCSKPAPEYGPGA